MKIETDEAIYAMKVNVYTQVIMTAEELKALGVGGKNGTGIMQNSDVAGNDITGYYILGCDIDCTGVIFAAGYSYQKSFFKGVFDGNGYKLQNVTVGSGGIFGGLSDAIIKNVKMENVSLDVNNSNVDGFYGNYTAIIASCAKKSTFTDIDVKVTAVDMAVGKSNMSDGLMTSITSNGCTYNNITVDAAGLELECILGAHFTSDNKVTNYVVKAISYSSLGYAETETEQITDKTWTEYDGVSFVFAAGEVSIKNASGTALSAYEGDVTDFGFAEGTTVYTATSTSGWSNRVVMSANNKASYFEFDFSFDKDVTQFTLWAGDSSVACYGAYMVTTTAVTPNDTTALSDRTIQVFDKDGNALAEDATSFAANTVYKVRIYFDSASESTQAIKTIHFGTLKSSESNPIVMSIANMVLCKN